VAALAALTLALLAAGCGGGSKPPAVASLGHGAAGASSGAGSAGAFAVPPGGAGDGSSISTQVGKAAGIRYAACMQSHGLPSFPEPNAQGEITITVTTSLDPGSPLFRSAAAHCQHLLPPGKGLNQAHQQRQRARVLAFAACMRAHGVPGYPDPTFGPGGAVSQGYGRADGIDSSSPIFQAAQKACGAHGPPAGAVAP
jgi:hypothetical protein